MTAELVAMDATEARAITDRIKTGTEVIWDLITRAYQERAWDALGYSSWDEYTTREFGTSRLRLPREERSEVVSSLREAGLSIRAIAAATGLGDKTVQRDLKAGVVNDYTSPDEGVVSDALAEELIAAEPVSIVGTDGKCYQPSRPKPKPPTEEQLLAHHEAEKLAAYQETFNRWSRAVDGLTNALSFAKTFTPPADLPSNYVSVQEFKTRLAALVEISNEWKVETR